MQTVHQVRKPRSLHVHSSTPSTNLCLHIHNLSLSFVMNTNGVNMTTVSQVRLFKTIATLVYHSQLEHSYSFHFLPYTNTYTGNPGPDGPPGEKD